MRKHAARKFLSVWKRPDQLEDPVGHHRFVHEDIRTFGQTDEGINRTSVARYNDRAIGCVGQGEVDWWMHHLRRSPSELTIIHHQAGTRYLACVDEWAERRPMLVQLPYANVVSLVSKIVLEHSFHWRRAPAIDRLARPESQASWSKGPRSMS